MLHLALIMSVLLSCVGAWIIVRRYRRRMQQLMSAPHPAEPTAPAPHDASVPPAPARISLADNRAAGVRLTVLLIVSSFLIAATSACIWWALSFPGEPLPPTKVAVMALVHSWPVVPALALMWRWSRKRLFGTLLLWCAATFVIMLWRQIEYRPLEALWMIVLEMGLSLPLLSLVFLGSATRAVAPWLLVPTAVLTCASVVGLDVLLYMAQHQTPLLTSSFDVMEAWLGFDSIYVMGALFASLACILAAWPAWMLGRALSRAYSRKWLSDLLVVFTAVWAFALTDRALTINDAAAAAMYLPLLWIPVIWLGGRSRPRAGRAPTLLVLRVFQQDARTQFLFDHVVERWRLSGPTVMIAGTDLADRTLDAADIVLFLEGKLARRFIVTTADVPRRIAGFDMAPDVDGRFRVNECYCHDTIWQDALQALVQHSDVVLMDLRGFKAHNAGCSYELATLARAERALRIVALTDSRTDHAAAQAVIASGRRERFSWIEAERLDANHRGEVLAHLFT